MLQDLVQRKKITARTKWKALLPTISSDAVYTNLLGQPGSTPLELFQDVVDDLEQKIESQASRVRAVFDKAGKTVTLETSFEEFSSVLDEAGDEMEMGDSMMREVLDYVRPCTRTGTRAISRADASSHHLSSDPRQNQGQAGG